MFCVSCPDHPKLVQLSPEVQIDANSPEKVCCKGCGYKFGADFQNKKVKGCVKCKNFFLCMNCKLCQNGHYLFKCFDLRTKKAGGTYDSNKYNCDCCGVTRTIRPLPPNTEDQILAKLHEQHFVWHCNTCNFDLCPRHFQVTSTKLHFSLKTPDLVSIAPECSVLTGTEQDFQWTESPKHTKTSSKFLALSNPPSLKVKLLNTLKSFNPVEIGGSTMQIPEGMEPKQTLMNKAGSLLL